MKLKLFYVYIVLSIFLGCNQTKNKTNPIDTVKKTNKIYKDSSVNIKSIINNAKPTTYTRDLNFKTKNITPIKFIEELGNNLCVLYTNGIIEIISKKGVLIKSLNKSKKNQVVSIATQSTKLFLFYNNSNILTKKYRGKIKTQISYNTPEVKIYNTNFNLIKTHKLKGLKTVFAAKIIHNKIIVTDTKSKAFGIFNSIDGKPISIQKGFRPCGNVLDIYPLDQSTFIIANLGNFSIDVFDTTGKKIGYYGNKGKALKDFQGCCNPVSLALLNNNSLLTIEKYPTRIKQFHTKGVTKFAPIKELENEKYMPIICDKKGDLYFGSSKNGIIKFSISN